MSMRTPSRLDAEGSTFGSVVPSNKTPNKHNATRHRGVVNRPIATSIGRAQEEFKLFVAHPEDIDHNLYGRFLGILKDAGIPWKAKRLPESREDAMHTMNALVLAINAYQHYQRDVEECFAEMEASMSVTRSHSHAQATDVSKLHNELAKMQKEFTTQTRTLAKESSTSREMVSSLKSRLSQAERDLNDSNTQVRKLKKDLEEERRRCKALTTQMASDSKPRFSNRASLSGPGARPRTPSHNGSMTDRTFRETRESRERESSTGDRLSLTPSQLPQVGGSARISHSGPAQAVTEGFIPSVPRHRPPMPASPLPWDNGRRHVHGSSSTAVGQHEHDSKLDSNADASPARVVPPPQPVTPPAPAGYTIAPLTPPETIQPSLLPQAAAHVNTQAAPAKAQSPGLSSDGEGLDSEASVDAEDGLTKKKKLSLKKFMNKLKISTKEKTRVTVPQPQL